MVEYLYKYILMRFPNQRREFHASLGVDLGEKHFRINMFLQPAGPLEIGEMDMRIMPPSLLLNMSVHTPCMEGGEGSGVLILIRSDTHSHQDLLVCFGAKNIPYLYCVPGQR